MVNLVDFRRLIQFTLKIVFDSKGGMN